MHNTRNTIWLSSALLIVAGFVVLPFVSNAQEVTDMFETTAVAAEAESVVTAEELSGQLEEVVVRPYSFVVNTDGSSSEVPIAPTQESEYQLKKRTVVGLQPVTWLAQPQVEDYIEFSGVTEPEAAVTLSVQATPIVVKEVVADNRGRWSVALGVNQLPEGEHTAYVQAEAGGAYSNEVAVAQFIVFDQEEVSNATWMLMITVGLILIIVLVVVNVQFYLNRHLRSMYRRPAVAEADPDTHIEMDEDVIESVTHPEDTPEAETAEVKK